MHFDVNARPAEIPAFISALTEIAGASAWRQRERDFDKQLRDNPLIGPYLDSEFGIERAMIDVLRYRRNTGGRVPAVLARADAGPLYSFAGMLVRVYRRLPPRAQHNLKRRVVGAIKDNVGLAPLAFEMRTVAHLMSSGFDVEFQDLSSGGGYDFLARKADAEVEVECKSISRDLGRKIHLKRHYQLGRDIYRPMRDGATSGVVRLVVATLPDRLFPNREFVTNVASTIAKALADRDHVCQAGCAASYCEFPIASSPFDCASPPRITEDQVVEYCSRMLGTDVGRHAMMVFIPRQSATVVLLRSAKPDEALLGVYHNLKEAAKQLSGTRPGIICVQFRNLTSAELREVAGAPRQSGEPTGIQLMTAKFFDSDARVHVHTVAYVAPGEFVGRQYQLGEWRHTEIQEDAASYVFTNKRHSGKTDARYRVFR